MTHARQTPPHGIALILVLVLISLGMLLLAGLARHHTLWIHQITDSRTQLQNRWAVRSIESSVLARAPELLGDDAARQWQINLDRTDWRVRLTNEKAKLPLHAISEQEHAESLLRQLRLSPEAMEHMAPNRQADLFLLPAPELAHRATLWGSRQMDLFATDPRLLATWLDDALSPSQITDLREALAQQKEAGESFDLSQACRDARIRSEAEEICRNRLCLEPQCAALWIQHPERALRDVYTVRDVSNDNRPVLMRFLSSELPPLESSP